MSDTFNIDFLVVFRTSMGVCRVSQYSVADQKTVVIRTNFTSWPTGTDVKDKFNYTGPMLVGKGEAAPPAKFCGECGTPRKPDGKFCHNCGVSISDVTSDLGDLFEEVKAIATGNQDGRLFLKKLIKGYCLASLDEPMRSRQSELLAMFLEKATVRQWINGIDDEAQDGKISVGQAQHLTNRIRSGNPLSDRDSILLEKFLTVAPMQAGYWGTIKAGLKHLDIVGNEEVFATALLNMEQPRMLRLRAANGEFMIFPNPFGEEKVPSSRTLNYMLRRILRQVRDLAKTNPESFIAVASSFASRYEGPYRARSFAAGYFYNGLRNYFDYSGRRVDRDLVAPRRSEAHPEIWNQHPQIAQRIIDGGAKSELSLRLAFQVIEDSAKLPIPDFDSNTLELALNSAYKPLSAEAIRQLIDRPQSLDAELSVEAWTKVITESDNKRFKKLVDRATVDDLPLDLNTFLAAIFAINENEEIPLPRRSELAIYFLRNHRRFRHTRVLRMWVRYLPFVKVIVSQHSRDYLVHFPDLFTQMNYNDETMTIKWLMNEFPDDRSFVEPLYNSITEKLDGSSIWSVFSWFSLFYEEQGGKLQDVAWRLFKDYYSDSLPAYTARNFSQRTLSDEQRSRFIEEIFQRSGEASISELVSTFMSKPEWANSFDLLPALDYPGTEKFAWEVLADPEQTEYHSRILQSSQLVKRVGDSLQISQMASASGLQLDLVLSYLSSENMRASLDPEFIFAAATSATVELSDAGLRALKNAGLSDNYWLRLAESGLPNCVDEALRFVKSKEQEGKWSENVLALLDSKVDAAKQLGLRFLDSEERELDMIQIWNALTESDDPEIIARVAEEALVSDLFKDEKLADLDGRVLLTRRKSRGAKESIKSRLDLEALEIAPKRLRALFELARAQNTRDREWAISRLAVLSLNGIEIPSFEAYETSGGGKDA